jgi:peroxiredoxin
VITRRGLLPADEDPAKETPMAENTSPRVGEMAPEFELLNQDKQKVRLSDFRGKKRVVLLFYPMDFSPTCTQEHCTFGPNLGQIQGGPGVIVFGVSTDSPYCHAAFRRQHSIPYDLLADTSRKMVKAYGMWAGEEPYNSSVRGTVVIDIDGRIEHWEPVAMREARTVEQLARVASSAGGKRAT